MKVIHESITEIGYRNINQDAIVWKADFEKNTYLYAVADGMGGHSYGDIASSTIANGISKWWNSYFTKNSKVIFTDAFKSLQECIKEINTKIYTRFEKQTICGSTVAILFIVNDRYGVISVGDSRIYRKRWLNVSQITKDDVWENQRKVIDELSDAEICSNPNRGKLINAVGVREKLSLSIQTRELKNFDSFLICSDGLYKKCPMYSLYRNMTMVNQFNIKRKIDNLLRIVFSNGASDNVSIILIKILPI